ncbi:MAG: DUF4166 domain-containing protein [Pseudomonadota bacterium]
MKHKAIAPPPRIDDTRFNGLLSHRDWARLPGAIRRRFGKRFSPGTSVLYRGLVTDMQISRIGRLLAHCARLIGGPLPFDPSSVNRPAIVAVTEDTASDGQFWIRQYNRRQGFPQVVHSSKRFAGPTGLEEYIGNGVGMALRVETDDEALYFVSDHYFIQVGQRRIPLPRWMSPGRLVVTHRHIDDTQFLFSLTLRNRWLGTLLHQDALFHETQSLTEM